jgi:hypothetical protein
VDYSLVNRRLAITQSEVKSMKTRAKLHPPIDPLRLVDVSDMSTDPDGPQRAFVDRPRGVVVQVWNNATPGCDGTPWEGTLRVAVKHTSGRTPAQATSRDHSIPITWDELQAIKDHFWPNRIAVEIYPPMDSVVNVADLRWLWVLPLGAVLPFNLNDSSPERLMS